MSARPAHLGKLNRSRFLTKYFYVRGNPPLEISFQHVYLFPPSDRLTIQRSVKILPGHPGPGHDTVSFYCTYVTFLYIYPR